jgi:hypothetical protein
MLSADNLSGDEAEAMMCSWQRPIVVYSVKFVIRFMQLTRKIVKAKSNGADLTKYC